MAVVQPGGMVQAQSLTAGAIVGMVRDEAGAPLAGVRVEVTSPSSGFRRALRTGRSGRYAFNFLPIGEYVLLAEALGYRPVEIGNLNVAAGVELETEARLIPAEPPVMERNVRSDFRAALPGSRSETGWTLSRLELARLPDERRDFASVARFTPLVDDDLVMEGLPAQMSRMTIEGIPFRLMGHPVAGQPDALGLAFPVSGVAGGEILPDGVDVEWGGFAGGRLDMVERRGGARTDLRLFADIGGPPLTRSKYYAPEDLSGSSVRAGLQVGGPVIRDTAHYLINVEAARLRTPFPRAWERSGIDSLLAAVAADSFGTDVTRTFAPSVGETKTLSGSARFDWLPSARNRLAVFAHGGLLEGREFGLGRGRYPSFGTEVTGTDVAAGAVLSSVLSSVIATELRAGFEFSRRTFTDSGTTLTLLPSGPVTFGTDPALSGEFRQSGFRLVETIHLTAGRHRFKLGGGGGIRAIRQAWLPGRTGAFVFGDVDRLGAADGAFSQVVGRPPLARFTGVEAGGFLQDRWHLAPGLALLLGLRVDWEKVPSDRIPLNEPWVAQSELRNDSLDGTNLKLSPRGGFSWDVANRHRWFVRGGGGVYHGVIDAEALSEAIATGTGVEGRRGLGPLGRWPDVPDSAAAPVQGGTLALVHPDVAAPRTGRAMVGISGVLGGGAALHFTVSYRHTDYLVRRHDLNLVPAPSGADQYGRPVYGTLVQSGAALVAQPGSNRRFVGFDQVTALDQDGYSDYLGFTVHVERRVGRLLTLSTGYTYSRTEDNWLGGRGWPEDRVTPFPDSLEGRDWADGRSDFDVPHRLVLGADLDFGAVRLGGFYGFRSGHPFTPGFRDGVDANGDGSWRNDPAFVDDQAADMGSLLSDWPCLLEQVGRFAERNACRGPSIQRLDLRLVLGPIRLGYPLELVVDALNVLDAEYAEVDRALYLVNPEEALTTDPATGAVRVPLVVNSDFGRVIRRLGSGRALRIGIRVNYE